MARQKRFTAKTPIDNFYTKTLDIPRIQGGYNMLTKDNFKLWGKKRKTIMDSPWAVSLPLFLSFLAAQRKSKPLLTLGSEKNLMLTSAEVGLPCCHSSKAAEANQTHWTVSKNFSSAEDEYWPCIPDLIQLHFLYSSLQYVWKEEENCSNCSSVPLIWVAQ